MDLAAFKHQRIKINEGGIIMPFGLGYYGASDEVNRELDYHGHPPKMSETTKQQIVEAIANDYPQIKDMSARDQKAVMKWIINEYDR